VTGLGGLNGNARGFFITDFADHEDIGILSEECAQCGCEGESGAGIEVDLADVGKLDFDRVFDGGDIFFGLVEVVEGGVEGGGFAAAGGACDEDHAIGFGEGILELCVFWFRHAGVFQGGQDFLGLQEAEDAFFAVEDGAGVDADIGAMEVEAAILWESAFSDIEFGHDFEAGGDARCEFWWRFLNRPEDTVLTIADAAEGFEGFDVDIGRPAILCIAEDGMDELDEGAVAGHIYFSQKPRSRQDPEISKKLPSGMGVRMRVALPAMAVPFAVMMP